MPYYQTVISCLKSFFSFYQFFFEKVVDIAETMSYNPLVAAVATLMKTRATKE